MTPSHEVDEVWHFHLLYTRSYWDDLCGKVLAAPLHHHPTTGGRAEARKFDDLYRRTLAAYTAAFGEEAPADLWPAPEIRFAPSRHEVRVAPAECWIIRKPRWLGVATRKHLVRALISMLATMAPVWEALAEPSRARSGGTFAHLVLAVLGIVAVFNIVRFMFETPEQRRARRERAKRRNGNSSISGDSSGCGSGGGDSGGDGGSGCGGGCGGGCGS